MGDQLLHKIKFIRLLEKCNLGGTLAFSEVKVTTCCNKSRAVFEKHKLSPLPPQRTQNSKGMKMALSKLPIIIYPR